MCINDLVCYSDFLHCINILNDPPRRYHVYVVLIQDIKELLEQENAMMNHTLPKENQCADFLVVKLDTYQILSFFVMSLLRQIF